MKTFFWIVYFAFAAVLFYLIQDDLLKSLLVFGSLLIFSGLKLREINTTKKYDHIPAYWHNFLNFIYTTIFLPSFFLFALGIQAYFIQ